MATGMGKKAASVACLILACSSGDAETGRRSSGGSDESASIAQAAEAPPFAVPTDGILASQAFGTIEGNSSVGEDGSFNYEVPLSVPEGRAGLTPSVLLRYSSRGGNGLVGVGWSTVAASRIARCKRTLARDGITAGIDFNTNFPAALNHYCLEGQALFPTGERTEHTIVFRTERADFSRIVGVYRDQDNVSCNGDPLYFIVYDQSGRIHEYGSRNSENNSRAEARRYLEGGALAAAVTPYAWNLSRSTDRSGNAISYFYDKAASAERILKRIAYTSRLTDAPASAYQLPCGITDQCDDTGGTTGTGGKATGGTTGGTKSTGGTTATGGKAAGGTTGGTNSSGGATSTGGSGTGGASPSVLPSPPAATDDTALREIRFLYEDRTDVISTFAAGFDLTVSKRLRRIEMIAPNPVVPSLLWYYQLGYQDSPFTTRSELKSLAWCDAKAVCLPQTTFEWHTLSTSPNRPRFGETNDYVVAQTVPLGGSVASVEDFTKPMLLDLDGDGRDDLLHTVRDARDTCSSGYCSKEYADIRVRLSSSTGLGTQKKVPSPFAKYQVEYPGTIPFVTQASRPTDFDGDGKVDLFARGFHWIDKTTGAQVPGYRLYSWNGTGFVAPSWVTEDGANTTLTFLLSSRYQRANLLDANGDGLLDVLLPDDASYPNYKWAFYAGRPGTIEVGAKQLSSRGGGLSGNIVDIDGDGRTDLLQDTNSVQVGEDGQLRIGYANAGFNPQAVFTDINGDGLKDMVFPPLQSGSDMTVQLNTGTWFTPGGVVYTSEALHYDNYGTPIPGAFRSADFNGDGLEDLLVLNFGVTNHPAVVDQRYHSYAIAPVILYSNGRTYEAVQLPLLAPRVRHEGSGHSIPPLGWAGVEIGDVDGNGLLDFVQIVESPGNLDAEGNPVLNLERVSFASGAKHRSDVIVGIKDGLKQLNATTGPVLKETIEYADISELAQTGAYTVASTCGGYRAGV